MKNQEHESPLNLDEEALSGSGFFYFADQDGQQKLEFESSGSNSTEPSRTHRKSELSESNFAEYTAE